jgi:hypothetical protein
MIECYTGLGQSCAMLAGGCSAATRAKALKDSEVKHLRMGSNKEHYV